MAECLGKLTLLHPETLLPRLQGALHATASPLMRTTIVTAIKFTITDQPQPVDGLLRHCIGDFLATIGDPQLEVRRVALVALNSAAHNKPVLVRDLLDTLLPQLYTETKVRVSGGGGGEGDGEGGGRWDCDVLNTSGVILPRSV